MVEQENLNGAQKLPLDATVKHMLEEARMILPGIQALFGFQLIAVFNEPFFSRLSPAAQTAHLAATGLVAVAVAMVLAPAAYHRQVEPGAVSNELVRVTTFLLTWALLPLAFGICADFYLICTMVLHGRALPALSASLLFAIFLALWFVYPRLRRIRRKQP